MSKRERGGRMTKKEADRIYMELIQLVDYPIETNIGRDFVEVIGNMGGDVLRFRGKLVDDKVVITEK